MFSGLLCKGRALPAELSARACYSAGLRNEFTPTRPRTRPSRPAADREHDDAEAATKTPPANIPGHGLTCVHSGARALPQDFLCRDEPRYSGRPLGPRADVSVPTDLVLRPRVEPPLALDRRIDRRDDRDENAEGDRHPRECLPLRTVRHG